MRMTIKESWPLEPLGLYNPHKPVAMGESGYSSVEEMQKELRHRWPKKQIANLPDGVRYVEPMLYQGVKLVRVFEVTLH